MFAEIKENLKDIQKINNSVILDNPVVVTQDKSVVLKFDAEKKGVKFDEPVGIYNLNRFLNVIEVLGDNFTDKIENNVIHLEKGKIKQKYETTAVQLLDDTRIDPGLFERVKGTEPFATFDLNVDLLKYLKKVASILGHKEVIIENGRIVVTTLDANDNYMDENIVEVDIATDEAIVIDVDALNKIPELNYNVTLHKNKNGNIVAYLTAEEEPYDILVAITKTINK